MLFNSYIFILLFLPLCILGYFGLNHFKKYNLAQAFLLGMSMWFYGYYNVSYLWILIFSVLVNFGVYLLMGKAQKHNAKKALMIAGVVINVGLLLYFKYMDFFIGNINGIFKADLNFLRIMLPLGISFFTFQQISFIVDAYRGEIPGYNFLHYASFVTYFPQLIAGPIVTHDELVPQFLNKEKKKINFDNLASGIYIFTLGLAKKVLIADTFGNLVTYGYAVVGSLNSTEAILLILAYTIQIYFDFSGYCDMAVGLGKMMNIDLPQNFNSPYKARTITEFWERWHMTLTRFFTKYVYIPLGGNRKGKIRTYVNVFLVFLISGFWHGANWTFVLWGVMHGVLNILTRMFKKFVDKVPAVIKWLVTFIFVNIAWVFFRAESISQAAAVIKKAFAFDFKPMSANFIESIATVEMKEVIHIFSSFEVFPTVLIGALFIGAILIAVCSKNAYERMQNFKPTLLKMITTLILLVWSVFSLAGISTFLYFNF